MAAYADWAYYIQDFGGSVIADETKFQQFALRASNYVDNMTMMRAQPYFLGNPTPIKNATCAAAEVLYRFSLNEIMQDSSSGLAHGAVVSEKNDGFSVAYADSGALNPDSDTGARAIQSRVAQAIEQYLRWTGLLYAGVAVGRVVPHAN